MAVWRSGYLLQVRGIGTPMRSKACRWVLVGSGEHRDGGGGSGEADLVTGQGGQVAERAAEAAVGLPSRAALAGGLSVGGRGAAGRGDRVVRGGRVLAGEGQWGPGAAQVPAEVAGEHADQHVGPDAFLEPVEHRPQVQVAGFDVPEVPVPRI